MTRKRFIKLLMASGYSRNAARSMARNVPGDSTYSDAYAAIRAVPALSNLDEAIGRMVREIERLCSAIGKGLSAFVKTFNDSMTAD